MYKMFLANQLSMASMTARQRTDGFLHLIALLCEQENCGYFERAIILIKEKQNALLTEPEDLEKCYGLIFRAVAHFPFALGSDAAIWGFKNLHESEQTYPRR